MPDFNYFFSLANLLLNGADEQTTREQFGSWGETLEVERLLRGARGEQVGRVVFSICLAFRLHSSRRSQANLVFGDSSAFEIADSSNIDKQLWHVSIKEHAVDVDLITSGGRFERPNILRTLSIKEMSDFINSSYSILDYEPNIPIERKFQVNMDAVWTYVENVKKNELLFEAILGATESDVNVFIASHGEEHVFSAAALQQWLHRVGRRSIEIVSYVAGPGFAITHLMARRISTLRSQTFANYFIDEGPQHGRELREILPAQVRQRLITKPHQISVPAWMKPPVFPTTSNELKPVLMGRTYNVRVFGPSCNIGTEDGRLLCVGEARDWEESTYLGNSEPQAKLDVSLSIALRAHEFVSRSFSTCVRRISEPAILIGNCWSANIGHFIIDMLPRLVVRDYIPSGDYYVVVGEPLAVWKKELLNFAGVPDNRIVLIGEWSVLFDDLIIPGLPGHISFGYGTNVFNFYNSHHVKQVSLDVSPSYSKRFFITREARSNDRRTIVNMSELDDLLIELDIAKVSMEDFSIPEKVQMFANAELVIATVGSGMYNMLLTPNKAKLVAIFPAIYGASADAFNVVTGEYSIYYFLADSIEHLESKIRTDMSIDINRFRNLIDKILSE